MTYPYRLLYCSKMAVLDRIVGNTYFPKSMGLKNTGPLVPVSLASMPPLPLWLPLPLLSNILS